MRPFRALAVLLVLVPGCAARAPRFPGPLAAIDRPAPRPVRLDAPGTDTPAPPASIPLDRGDRRDGGFGDAVAAAARHHLRHAPDGFRDDCSGFVMAAFARAGSPITGNSRSLWEDHRATGATFERGRPRPGDLAFFDDTYDRNGNGRRDDPLTHVAVVLEVGPDGTILLAHGGTSQGRTTLRMNLDRPSDRADESGQVLNDPLRARRRGDPEHGRYLAGELFRGFARPAAGSSDES